MKLMADGMAPLREMPRFIDLLLHLEHPWAGLLTGMVLTAMIQSSAAFIGILITLTTSGLITFEAALLSIDRKSTRLNSSHVRISYAVFCLKKKTMSYRFISDI